MSRRRSVRPRGGPADNLPSRPTALVGRQHEIQFIGDALLSNDTTLLTLTGPPGVGKTRLAVEAGHILAERFEHGACFIDLAPLNSPRQVPVRIARTLGLREGPGQPLKERLRSHLRHKSLLLILDNFEHVAGAAPEIAELLDSCPRVKVLVTSRAPLHLRREHEVPVPPLAVPDLRQPLDLESLPEYPAVSLFHARARAVRPEFHLTAENAMAVAEICAHLDGLPLAIELAAAHVRHLPPQVIAERLQGRLGLPEPPALDRPPRHKTMPDAIAWSFDLLDAGERELFQRLAVFVGGCSLEAAEALGGSAHIVRVLDTLASLVHKSLLRQVAQPGGKPRYRMLEPIREFARDRLAAGGQVATAEGRHAGYFLHFAEARAPRWHRGVVRPMHKDWLDQLELEHDNFRVVVRWFLDRGDAASAIRLTGALRRFWFVRGYWSEAREWIRRALSIRTGAPPVLQASLLEAAGFLAWVQDDYTMAQPLLQESLELYRQIGDQPGIATVLRRFGQLARTRGDYAQAEAFGKESLAMAQAAGEQWGIAESLGDLAWNALDEGRSEQAIEWAQKSVELYTGLGDEEGALRTLGFVASAAYHQGNLRQATALCDKILTRGRKVGYKFSIVLALDTLAKIARHKGDDQLAAGLLKESLQLEFDQGDRRGIARCLEAIASIAAHWQPDVGARLVGAVAALREFLGAPVPPSDRPLHEQMGAMLRDLLGPEDFAAAVAAGRTIPPDEAVALALSAADWILAGRTKKGAGGRLTRRELDVAALVAQGRSNREIADTLLITQKTAAHHVQHILDKLGFHSRVQVAAWMAAQGKTAQAPGPSNK